MKDIKLIISTGGTFIFYLLGGFDNAIIYLFIAILIDYITGIIKAIKNKKLNSEIGIKGITKKIYMLCLVAISVLVDRITNTNGIIRNLMIYYIIANEGLSIIENGAEFGFPVPKFLKESLEQLSNKESENK